MSNRRAHQARKEQIGDELKEPIEESQELAERLGLEPFDVAFRVVDYDEMNEYAAYGGYPERYPHWRWGMVYDTQAKKSKYMPGRLYELVINNDPAHAYLQESNRTGNQKLTITHVYAHSDFFANNEAFQRYDDGAQSVDELANHAREVEEIMEREDVDRDEVERWIDNLLTIEDNINQHLPYKENPYDGKYEDDDEEDEEPDELADKRKMVEAMDLTDSQREDLEEWLDEQEDKYDTDEPEQVPAEPEEDLYHLIKEFGRPYDLDAGQSSEMEDWQEEVIDIMRDESYFFGPQKMTKVMNEGWSAYWHAMMMEEERFATQNEIIDYAESNAGVLSGSATNPYTLGKHLFQYIENDANRKEVASKLLRVEGITPNNFHDAVDFEYVNEELEPDEALAWIRDETLDQLEELDEEKIDWENLEKAKEGEIDIEKYPWKVLSFEGLAERHFSLIKPQNRAFLSKLQQDDAEEIVRYLDDEELNQYSDIDEALADVDYTAGWDKMYEVRETHVDETFIDEFFTQEFVDKKGLFTYEYGISQEGGFAMPIITSTDVEDVKKKLVFQHVNFGKPIVKGHDVNYADKNQLMLGHHYNGVQMDQQQTAKTLERVHEMWGRPVHLRTIEKVRDEEYLQEMEWMMRQWQWQLQQGYEPDLDWPQPDEQPVQWIATGDGVAKEPIEWKDVEEMGLVPDETTLDSVPDEWKM